MEMVYETMGKLRDLKVKGQGDLGQNSRELKHLSISQAEETFLKSGQTTGMPRTQDLGF